MSSRTAEHSPVFFTTASLEMRTAPSTQWVLSYSLNAWNTRKRLTAMRWHRRMTYTKLGVPDYNQGVKDKEWQNREKRKKRPVAPWAGHDCHGEELCPCKGNITAETSEVSRRTRKERWSEGTSKLLCLKHSGWRLRPLTEKLLKPFEHNYW